MLLLLLGTTLCHCYATPFTSRAITLLLDLSGNVTLQGNHRDPQLKIRVDTAAGPWMLPFQILTTLVITAQDQSFLLDFTSLEARTVTSGSSLNPWDPQRAQNTAGSQAIFFVCLLNASLNASSILKTGSMLVCSVCFSLLADKTCVTHPCLCQSTL